MICFRACCYYAGAIAREGRESHDAVGKSETGAGRCGGRLRALRDLLAGLPHRDCETCVDGAFVRSEANGRSAGGRFVSLLTHRIARCFYGQRAFFLRN